MIKTNKSFKFFKIDIEDAKNINEIFQKYKPNVVYNLAAQAGVRYSIENPSEFINTNIKDFKYIRSVMNTGLIISFMQAVVLTGQYPTSIF